tara:strand:- start:2213 stop:2656 length:444 start_codon:yes stop_codon:yes gene_type:complete
MPNWCYNRVEIFGDDEKLAKIKKQVETKESLFDFDTIIPTPNFDMIPNDKGELPEVRDDDLGKTFNIKQFPDGSQDDRWYDWHIDNWGTKWNSCDCEVEDEGDVLRYTFNTAWGPPEPIICKLRELYPDVSISAFYDEPGMEFAGYL